MGEMAEEAWDARAGPACSYRGRFVIDEIFLCDNKKELQKLRQHKKSTRSEAWDEVEAKDPTMMLSEAKGGKKTETMKETKATLELCGASIIFHLPLFVWCTALKPLTPSTLTAAIISKIRVFYTKNFSEFRNFSISAAAVFFSASLFSPDVCSPLAYTQKHNQLYENCERFSCFCFLLRQSECSVCEYPHQFLVP